MDESTDGQLTGQSPEPDHPTAAEELLRSLGRRGIRYIFANFGTDHTPILEAAARIRDAGEADAIPAFVTCPHEYPAMSAAHGYAAATGDPQAVLVHVDVGTQNLGGAVHNAHRANVPVVLLAGLAPVTHAGHQGSRDISVHYFQDVFDQPGIVREYCRWYGEIKPPSDPDELVARAIERAMGIEPGPVYLSATREALETPSPAAGRTVDAPVRQTQTSGADPETVAQIAERVAAAERPVLLTNRLGAEPGADDRVRAAVRFAEAAGAGVVEHSPSVLSFPRDHDLHAGYRPASALEHADLVVLAGADVPWIPSDGEPREDATVIQVEADPTMRTYPRWPFNPDVRVAADPAATLESVSEQLDPAGGEAGRAHWSGLVADRRAAADRNVEQARADGRLTPAVLAAAIDDVVDDATTIVDDAVTSRAAILEHVRLSRPGSYLSKGGAGLGWGGGAAVGVALARPDERIIALEGDGSYLFSHPTVSTWMAATYGAPALRIIFDNRGWHAVETATRAEHPDGASVAAGVPESRFGADLDLTAPATAVESVTRTVTDPDELPGVLGEGIQAVDEGLPAVIAVEVDRPGD